MNLKADSGIWSTMFGVPCIVADNFLKIATEKQLKALLYVLRCPGTSFSYEEIAANTGMSPSEAAESIAFWQQVNVLHSDSSSPALKNNIMTTPEPEQPTEIKPAPKSKSSRRADLNPSEISEIMNESTDLAQLFKTAEGLLGSLNHTQQNSLIWMNNYLGLKSEVIITLLGYCISIEKTNASYVEKIAFSWAENGINSFEAAQKEITRMTKSYDFTAKVTKAFEMKRSPTDKQRKFISTWEKEGYSIELIHYAYEKTIERIDKLSFEYINKILETWKSKGFITVQNVKDSEADFRRDKKASSSADDDFDVDKYKIFINNF